MRYLLKIWLLTCAISPMIIILINSKSENISVEIFDGFLFVFFCGLLLSLPAILILYFVYLKIYSNTNYKIVLSILSFFLVFLTFYITDFNVTDYKSDFYLFLIYSIVMILLIFLIKDTDNFE